MTHYATLADGTRFEIADHELILDAALRQGVELAHGCRGGACGACRCKVEGSIEYLHDPMALSADDQAEGMALLCIAKAQSDLRLEAKIEAPPAVQWSQRYHITVQPSGKEFIAEAGETIVDAAIRLGLPLPYGCRGGNCGACEVELMSGEVEYKTKPWALEKPNKPALNNAILTCVANPKSDLTIKANLAGTKTRPVQQMPTKIVLMKRLSADVMQLGLKLPEEMRLPYLAGQYVDFLLEDGERRAFSIANAPHKDAILEFHIRHVPDGKFTDQLFNTMQLGDRIRLEGPFGSFYLREKSQRPLIFLATGTGFGPLKAIFEHLLAEGAERPVYLYWGAYNQQAIYMYEVANEWELNHPHFHFRPVLTNPAADWQGRVGLVQEVVVKEIADLVNYEVYACGNPNMVHAARDLLVAHGLDRKQCYSDAFELAAPQKAAAR